MNLNFFKEGLKKYSRKDIIFTRHAEIQAIVRDIDLEEIKDNIINPEKLVYFREQDAKSNKEKKI